MVLSSLWRDLYGAIGYDKDKSCVEFPELSQTHLNITQIRVGEINLVLVIFL
jgi:hypothetical protein